MKDKLKYRKYLNISLGVVLVQALSNLTITMPKDPEYGRSVFSFQNIHSFQIQLSKYIVFC